MKHNNKKQAGCLKARVAALMATFCLCTGAWAENKVVIDNINILPGGEAVVNVDLQNEDNIMSTIQMDVVIPNGVDVKDGSIRFIGNRVDEEDFLLFMQQQGDSKVYRIVVLPQDPSYTFSGNSGNLLQFTVTANSNLQPKQQIEVKDIVGSDTNATKYEMASFNVNVQQMVGSFSIEGTAPDNLLLKPSVEGNSQRISFSLSNTISVRALEAVITLPEGAQVVKNEKGSVKIDRGSRVPTNLKFSSAVNNEGTKVKVVLSGLTADVLKGTEGEVFAFYVSGTDALPEESVVTVDNVVLSDNSGNSFDVYETHSLNLINMDKVYLTPAQEILDSINTALEEAMTTINEECADVKDSVSVQEAIGNVNTMITDLTNAIQAAYDDETLASDYDNIVAAQEEIMTAIATLVETARKAQADYETEQALNAAYAYAQAELEKLDSVFAEAVETINNECPDVKDSEAVQTAKTTIEGQIAALREAVEAGKADGTLIEKQEELLTKKAEAEAAITAMVETAKKAQADYETEQALNAAYAYAQAELEKLDSVFAEAVETINNECPDVKDVEAVQTAKTAIEGQIAALREAIEAGKADGTLIEKQEELLTKKAEAEAAITAMVETAKKAQADYEAEQALNAAYAQAIEVVNELSQKLSTAMEAIETFCPDVKDSTLVTDAKAAIEEQISALSEAVEAGKADGSLTDSLATILAPKTTIEAAISKLLEDARQAQKDIDTGIEEIAAQQGASKIYTLSGKQVNRMEKGGIYLIKYANGTTKKVMVK